MGASFASALTIRNPTNAERFIYLSGALQEGQQDPELIHRRGLWPKFEAFEFATLNWVASSNNRRLLEPIGNIPPAEAEQRYYAMLEQPAMAA